MSDVRILIVGGGLAGCTVAKALEDAGRGDDVLVIDPDRHAPYDRPPLTKAFLGAEDGLTQRPPWAPTSVAWRADCVVAVDLATRTARTASGGVITAETIVLAAGSLARTLPGRDGRALTVRTADDARRVRDLRRAGAQRFLIEGAGPLGLELASTLASDGADVTVVDPATAPMERLLGGALANEVAGWAQAGGVRLLLDAKVVHVALRSDGGAVEVMRSDGTPELFDCMITAVGSVPAPLMLIGPAGPVGAAVVDDRRRLVDVDGTVFPGIYSAGDLPFHRDVNRTLSRSESWTAARVDGEAVVRDLLGEEPVAAPVPYFWTRQFGRMVQVLGTIPLGADVHLLAEVPKTGGSLYQATHGGAVVAYVGVNAQRLVAMLQTQPGPVADWAPPEG
jgi:3-phenylpropionate/trans-cinnamate dioxygenase ferredoxin reductase subunit